MGIMLMSDKTITRAHLTDIIYREIGLSHAESADLVDSVFEEITAALETGDTVKLSSFGTFSIRQKKERIGRNPKTKEEVPISARKVVTFHASNILTKKVNNETPTSLDISGEEQSANYSSEVSQGAGFLNPSDTGGVDSGGSTGENY
jgi:integration host factor subunit alpha